MSELDIDISDNTSKSLEQYQQQPFDLVVTVCDNAKESCPVFSGAGQTLHWPFDDPHYAEGSIDEVMAMFRRVRDEIKVKVRAWLTEQDLLADQSH